MICAHCGSPDLQKLSLVCESGISHISTTTAGGGIGIGAMGIGVGVGRGQTRGSQVSQIALRAAPPRPWNSSAGAWAVIFFIVTIISFFKGWYQAGFIVAILTILAGWVSRNVFRYNREVFPRLWAEWDASYLCLRCGLMAPPSQRLQAVTSSALDPQTSKLTAGPQQLPNARSQETSR